ncbi:MAG: hypothetical protein ABR507_03325 [Actinomycetota bacterium]
MRSLWLSSLPLKPVSLPVHGGYEFSIPALPAPAVEEMLAEKLAAWRRRRKLRGSLRSLPIRQGWTGRNAHLASAFPQGVA